MCKEMSVVPVIKVVDPKRIIEKMEGQGGGEAQGGTDPPPPKKIHYHFHWHSSIPKSGRLINSNVLEFPKETT
jgi:hypothetical protein